MEMRQPMKLNKVTQSCVICDRVSANLDLPPPVLATPSTLNCNCNPQRQLCSDYLDTLNAGLAL